MIQKSIILVYLITFLNKNYKLVLNKYIHLTGQDEKENLSIK